MNPTGAISHLQKVQDYMIYFPLFLKKKKSKSYGFYEAEMLCGSPGGPDPGCGINLVSDINSFGCSNDKLTS